MKIVWNWLADWIDLRGDIDQVVETLTRAGVEVASVASKGGDYPKVVIARILESNPHPDADRLSVCQVDDGSGESRQIVCGAKNYKVGDKVPLALPGAVLPGLKIKVNKLRGVRSEGMMCSAKELELAEDAQGLLILPDDAVVGQPVGSLFPKQTVIEVEITPNRPDLLSHRGIARILNAFTGWPLQTPETPSLRVDQEINLVPVEVVAGKASPFYTARRITGVKVAPSPDWMQRRLELAGLRPINNIVDITNYILLDIGQPLHAFDAAKLAEDRIVVRDAKAGEKMIALDGRELTLDPSQPVIADGAKAQALAGVMGGEHSGVEEGAGEVVLESAWFDPPTIRRSARLAGISSDSSYRFERGANLGAVEEASDRAASLFCELAGGTAGPITKVGGGALLERRTVSFRPAKARQLLGLELSDQEIDELLIRIGCEKKGEGWLVPIERLDLEREVDLIEEIAHLHGIDQTPSRVAGPFASESDFDRLHDLRLALLHQLAALGFNEVRNLTLLPDEPPYPPLEVDPVAHPRKVRNPLTVDHVTLRTSLLPGLLTNLIRNLHAGVKSVQFCETGNVSWTGGQAMHLGLLLYGPAGEVSWYDKSTEPRGFHHLKAALETVVHRSLSFEATERPGYIPVYEIRSAGEKIGLAAQVAPAVQRSLDAAHPIWVAELSLEKLMEDQTRMKAYREYPRQPAVTRDIALVAPDSLSHAAVESAILGVKEPLLEAVNLFDIFEDPSGEKLPAGKKSMAYSIVYRAPDRTLTADEAKKAHDKVRAALTESLGVELRE